MIDYAADFRAHLWNWHVAAITELSARDDFREVSVRSNWEQTVQNIFTGTQLLSSVGAFTL